ncbi:MAG: hypothetical protein ACJA08_001713 [Cyclobacteriaceae bacterium]|jgi:hypothetical protein
MKNIIGIILIALLTSCIAEREYVVDYDYSYKGKFKKYKTFSFLTTNDTINYNGMSDFLIKEEIQRRMKSQGYAYNEKKPSILIAYKIFGEDFKLQGYEQLDLVNWETNYGQYDLSDEDISEIQIAKYNDTHIDLRKGTLLIDFIDTQTHSVIWQGYASGLFDDATLFSKDAKYAVRTILNQYKLLAYNYIPQ